MGVVSQTRPPCFSGVIFAPIEFSHWRQRQADFSETIKEASLRPRPLMLILSRDYMQIRAAEQEYRGPVARQPILPEMTSYRK